MLMLSVQVNQYGAGVGQLGGAGERIVKVSAASTFGGDNASQNEFVTVWSFKATFDCRLFSSSSYHRGVGLPSG